MIPVGFDPKQGYPGGPNLRYRCEDCHTLVPSFPAESQGCKCGNLFIDVDQGRFGVDRAEQVTLWRIEE